MNLCTETIIAGHPFASVGMGEQMRSAVAALKAVHVPIKAFDVFRYAARIDPDHRALIEPIETLQLENGIRVFHINGNEIEAVLQHLAIAGHKFNDGYNIVVPAWELPSYPSAWAKLVREFDEAWAISNYVKEILERSNIKAFHVSQNVEIPTRPLLPRRYFGIRESAFVLLNFFDLSSYAQRKNPEAAVELFCRLRKSRPYDDLQLVFKVKDGDQQAENWVPPHFDFPADTLTLRRPLSAYETHSLINCCDCLVSLHRAEGFGRGAGEAMFLGRLALATGWSGNLDYMTDQNSLLVNYSIVPTHPDAYPFAKGQHWAEPDIDHAFALLLRVIDDLDFGRRIAAIGRRDVIKRVAARPVGLAMAKRIREILHATEKSQSHLQSGTKRSSKLIQSSHKRKSRSVRSISCRSDRIE